MEVKVITITMFLYIENDSIQKHIVGAFLYISTHLKQNHQIIFAEPIHLYPYPSFAETDRASFSSTRRLMSRYRPLYNLHSRFHPCMQNGSTLVDSSYYFCS